MAARRSASAVSSDGSGASRASSSTAWRSQSASRCARSTSARWAATSASRARRSSHRRATSSASPSSAPNASSSRRWVATSTSARSSCWPWISTSAAPMSFIVCTLTGWSLTKARGAAVGDLHPAQDQLVLGRDVVGGHQRADRMAGGQLEGGGHLPLLGAPWRTSARRRARRAPARSRRAGSICRRRSRRSAPTARGEVDVEPVDQDDVADREPNQHGSCPVAQASRAESPAPRLQICHHQRRGWQSQLGLARVTHFCDDVSNCRTA